MHSNKDGIDRAIVDNLVDNLVDKALFPTVDKHLSHMSTIFLIKKIKKERLTSHEISASFHMITK